MEKKIEAIEVTETQNLVESLENFEVGNLSDLCISKDVFTKG